MSPIESSGTSWAFGGSVHTMNFAPLTPDDLAALDSDRDFAIAVLEARFPGIYLIGTSSDIEVLQRILDGGPYTDSAEGELVALGTSLGDLLGRATGMEWVRYTDEYGSDLGLRYGQTSIVIFPRDMIIKRVEKDEVVDLQHLYAGVIREIQQLVTSGIIDEPEFWAAEGGDGLVDSTWGSGLGVLACSSPDNEAAAKPQVASAAHFLGIDIRQGKIPTPAWSTPFMDRPENESSLRTLVHDAFSSSVCKDGKLTLKFTCIRAGDFAGFVASHGHTARFEAPRRLFDAIRLAVRSDRVFRCFQEDGFTTVEPIAMDVLTGAFRDFPLVYTKLFVDVDASSHDRCWRSVEWILMFVHRGIAEATPTGSSLHCFTPPEFAT